MNEIILKSIETYYSKETMKINDIDCRVTFVRFEDSECESECEFSLGVYAENHDVKLIHIYFNINELNKWCAEIVYRVLSEDLIGKETLENLSVNFDNHFIYKYNFNFVDANGKINFDELNNIILKALMCEDVESATFDTENINNINDFVIILKDIYSFITVM